MFFPSTYPNERISRRNTSRVGAEAERAPSQPILGKVACCASARWIETKRITVSSQRKSFGFMAAPYLGQWICHSPKPMKTDIFVGTTGSESGKSARGVADLIRQPHHWIGHHRSTVLNL